MTINPQQVFLLVLLLSPVGCGPPTSEVKGKVTAAGQPIEAGVIAFSPLEGEGDSITVEISAGSYSLRTISGKKLVQISAPVVVGKRPEFNGPGAPLVEITEESVLPKYNSASELRCELKPGLNSLDFQVETRRTTPQARTPP
jgi:hypothetical protein